MTVWYLYIALYYSSVSGWNQVAIPQYNEKECNEAMQTYITKFREYDKYSSMFVTCIKGWK